MRTVTVSDVRSRLSEIPGEVPVMMLIGVGPNGVQLAQPAACVIYHPVEGGNSQMILVLAVSGSPEHAALLEALSASIEALASEKLVALDLASKAAGVRDGWEVAAKEIPMDNDEIVIDPGDWIWRDANGRIRRTYGWAGGSYERAHTFDAQGRCVVGVEARDEKLVPFSDLRDKDGIHPMWRAVVEKYPIETGP